MRGPLLAAAAVVGVALLQTGVAGRGVGGVHLDLLLLWALAAGMRGGEAAGAAWGVGLGFVQDTFSAGLPGTGVLTKGLAGLAAGALREQLDCESQNTQALVAVVATLADGALHLALRAVFSEGGDVGGPFLAVVAPSAAAHGALLPAALALGRVLARRLRRRPAATTA